MHLIDIFMFSLSGLSKHASDLSPIDTTCPCPTCSDGVSRAMLHHIVTLETAAAHGELQVYQIV